RLPPVSIFFPYTTLFRSVDALDVDPSRDGGLFRMFAIDFNRPRALGKFAGCRAEILMRGEGNHRTRWIEVVGLTGERWIRQRERSEEHTSELQSQSNLVC